ncbi:MAG: DNA-binding response regulator [Spirosoma sp.]|nr:DNA-binding response regulator [Spirosoma sp.]
MEDEALLAMDLGDLLEEEGYTVIGTANNGPQALRLHQTTRVDLALCDIFIKGEWDGIDTVQRLLGERPIPIVFLTAMTDRVTLDRAMKTFPAAYLIKPITVPGLRAAVELALRNFTQPLAARPERAAEQGPALSIADGAGPESILPIDEAVFIKHHDQFVKIALNDIEYLEADGAYSTLVTLSHRFVIRLSMSLVLTRLNFPRLVRIHRSYAINLNRIQTFTEREVSLSTQTLPVGRLFKSAFLSHFNHR